jgi:hypothetical protein
MGEPPWAESGRCVVRYEHPFRVVPAVVGCTERSAAHLASVAQNGRLREASRPRPPFCGL